MDGKFEVTWKTLKTIAHSLMVNTWTFEEYIYIALMYTTDYIFLVLPIKHLVNQYGEPAKPQRLATVIKPSV